MVGIVEAEAPYSLDVLRRKGGQQKADVGDVFCDVVSSKDVARHDSGLPRLGDVSDAARQNCIAVVRLAIPGKEANESLV